MSDEYITSLGWLGVLEQPVTIENAIIELIITVERFILGCDFIIVDCRPESRFVAGRMHVVV